MAPYKRRADLEFEEEIEVDRDESQSVASSQSASRKRRRLTNGNSVHEDSESEEDRYLTQFDSDNEEEFEHLANQAIREKYALNRANVPAECGILEEVRVENFMCHEICIFEVGPLINFICGKNGSGKSAILTAITLCLGGKATSTSRGSSLKNFIKEGKDNCYIVVKIKNQGDGAYMPDVYGETIQVERHFNRSGASGFKLKNKNGKIISTKKSELEEICDHFALQIDNPMNVLSQDAARSFIASSSAADKYKSFIRGVQLEQLDQDYRLIEDNLDQIEYKLNDKRPSVEVLKKQMEHAKAKLTQSKSHEVVLQRLRDYRRQIAWAQVQEQEKIRDEYIEEIRKADEKIAEAEQDVEELNRTYEEADRKSSEATTAYEAAVVEVDQGLAEKADDKVKHDEIKKETLETQSEQRSIRDALKDANNTITAKQAEIAEEEQRLAELGGGGAAARLAGLEQAKEAVKDTHRNFEEHNRSLAELQEKEKKASAELKERQQNASSRKKEVEQQQKNVEEFAEKGRKQDDAFFPQLPTLLRAIEQERRFAQKPIGPVGRHVRLLKPQWSSILEVSFGSTLNSFIVTSKSDMNILDGIMKRVRCQYPIMIGNNQPINTKPNEPDEQFDTSLRVLEIDNDLVRKQLIIQHSIENTILITDVEEASKVLFSGPRPRNVKQCFSISLHDKRRGFRQAFSRNSEPSQDPIRPFEGRSRMKTDFEAQLRIQREALQESKGHLLALDNDARFAQDSLQKAKQAIVRHKKHADYLRIEFQKAEDKVEELHGAIQQDSVESGKLEVLRNALSEAENERTLHEGSYQDSVIALDAKKAQLNDARASLVSFDERIAKLQEASTRSSLKAQKLSKERSQALGEKNAAISRIDDAKVDRSSYERKRDELNGRIEGWVAQAREISERVNVPEGETGKSLTAKYEKLGAEYQKLQRQMGATREEIADNAARTSQAYAKGKQDLHALEAIGQKMKLSLMERRQRWKAFRSFITCRAKAQFTYLLSERSFRGSLNTDHNSQTLELSVEPDITKRNGEGRGAKTLSGGEKSFSQICLLLAIWEAMGSPIRCLDEFDVYMDAVNRNMSVKLLIEAARMSVGRQFIFISPGTKSDIRKADDVNAIEMAAPERGQTRLNFGDQAA